MYFHFVRLICIALVSIAFHSPAMAAETLMNCPETLPESSLTALGPSPEWVAYVPSPLPLTGATVMQGEPYLKTPMKPTTSERVKGKLIDVWKFEGEYPEGKWLACNYGGVVFLSRKIPNYFASCAITYVQDAHGKQQVGEIACE